LTKSRGEVIGYKRENLSPTLGRKAAEKGEMKPLRIHIWSMWKNTLVAEARKLYSRLRQGKKLRKINEIG